MRKRQWIALVLSMLLCVLPNLAFAEEVSPSPSPSASPAPALDSVYDLPSVTVWEERSERVLRIQQRLMDLGYLHYRPTGYYLSMTAAAVESFQQANGIELNATIDSATSDVLFSANAVRQPIDVLGSTPQGTTYSGAITRIPWGTICLLYTSSCSLSGHPPPLFCCGQHLRRHIVPSSMPKEPLSFHSKFSARKFSAFCSALGPLK